jgi:hypothetical protein
MSSASVDRIEVRARFEDSIGEREELAERYEAVR